MMYLFEKFEVYKEALFMCVTVYSIPFYSCKNNAIGHTLETLKKMFFMMK